MHMVSADQWTVRPMWLRWAMAQVRDEPVFFER
jgi:hypothetical protein